MSVHQGRFKEEPFCESGLDAVNSLPVGGAEVSAKSKVDLEEQVFSEGVRECSCYIGVVLDLSEAQLDVIGVDANVFVWVQYLQVVSTNSYDGKHRRAGDHSCLFFQGCAGE